MSRLGISPLFLSKLPRFCTTAFIFSVMVAPRFLAAPAVADPMLVSVERYEICVAQEAIASARTHVRDPDVVRSSVPEKALAEFVNLDVEKACGPLLSELLRSENGDGALAGVRGYHATKVAIGKALAATPPPPHPPAPGSDDYAHGEKLENGAWEYLSTECKALLDWGKYAVPASCNDEVRKANTRYKEEIDLQIERLLATPDVRFCLGLRSEEEKESGPPPGWTGNRFEAIEAEYDEDQRKLQAALDDRSEALKKCVTRIRAAGGLVFVDPAHEMARANRIPEVKQASDKYARCTTDRATEFARVSNEPAEIIARAALGGCSVLREQYLAALARALGIVMTREIAAQEEKEVIGALIGQVITARAAAAGRSSDASSAK